MDISTERPASSRFSTALAGLQAGMVGGLWMLTWMGSSSVWQGRSFWTPENLLATVFYGGRALRQGFSGSTLSGLAVYLIVYSILGSSLAATVRLKLPPLHLVLASIALAVAWYYLSFHLIWKVLSPLVPLLHAARPTLFGHVIYGAMVARFPRYVPHTIAQPAPESVMTPGE
jgi:hypothetical protein